jgi:hypothetical protein
MPWWAQALAFSKFQGPLFQPIRAPYLSEDPQKPRSPSSTLNSGPNRSRLKYVLGGTLDKALSDYHVVRPRRYRVVRRRRAPSVRKVMFQGSYRYRPVTQLSHTKNALIHPSVVSGIGERGSERNRVSMRRPETAEPRRACSAKTAATSYPSKPGAPPVRHRSLKFTL